MYRQLLLCVLVTTLNADLLITRLNSNKGPDPCARICAGTTGKGSTAWHGSGAPYYYVYTRVDMSECGFLGTPIITALVDGKYNLMLCRYGSTSSFNSTVVPLYNAPLYNTVPLYNAVYLGNFFIPNVTVPQNFNIKLNCFLMNLQVLFKRKASMMCLHTVKMRYKFNGTLNWCILLKSASHSHFCQVISQFTGSPL